VYRYQITSQFGILIMFTHFAGEVCVRQICESSWYIKCSVLRRIFSYLAYLNTHTRH